MLDLPVGVTGSASTPHRLLEKLRDWIGDHCGAEVIDGKNSHNTHMPKHFIIEKAK